MSGDWIKICRSILKWGWYDEPATKDVFLHLLLKANWQDGEYHGHKVGKGEVVFGRKKFAKDLGLSEQQVRTAIKHLHESGEISTTKTTNRFTIIKVEKWALYQGNDEASNQQTNQQATNKQPTTNHIQEGKKERRKEKNIYLGVSDETKADAEAVLSYLNEKSGKHFKDGKGNMENILARLKEGYKVSDLKRVIDLKVNEWKDDQKMNEWINPVTLFRPKNFERYLNTMNTEQDNEEAELFATILRKMRNGMGYHRLYNKEQKVITLDGFMRAQKYLDTAADEDLIEMLKGA